MKDETLDADDFTVVEALDDAILEQANSEVLTGLLAKTSELIVKELYDNKIETTTRVTRKKRESHAITKQEKISCDECGILLANNTSMRRHIDRIHRKMRNFHCDKCSYSAFFKHSIEKHIVKHIPEEFRDRYFCLLCDFVSISPVNIVLHKKYEHGEEKKTFRCDICSKSFSRPGQLTAHNRLTHQKVKDKICSSCTRAFSTCKCKILLDDESRLLHDLFQIS